MIAFKEANLALQAKLEETRNDLARAEESVSSLVQEASKSDAGRKAALMELKRVTHAYDMEVVRSTRHRNDRETVKAEMATLLDNHRTLRASMSALESRVDSSFGDGYFTTSYEVAKAFPPPFDLHTTLNWDRDLIMARATQFEDQDQEGPPQAATVPEFSEKGTRSP